MSAVHAHRPRIASLATLTASAVVILLFAAPARAGVHSVNFDSVAAGTTVNSGPASLTMPQNPVAFNASGKTQSNPNALRRAGNCPNSGSNCTTGDHRLVMNFSSPARSVSMRVGTVVPSTCFELDCPTVRLVGYDSSGDVVAQNTPSPELVPDQTITHTVSMDAFAFTISKAIYVVSGDPLTGARQSGDGEQWTAQLDNLTYNVFDPGDPAPPPPPAAPSVSITDPVAGDTFVSTDVDVKGEIGAPAGVSRFCVVANGGASIPSDCNRAAAVADDGSFSVLRVPGMRPGTNTIRAWAQDGLGRVVSDRVDVRVGDGDVDFVAETLEVNQAVQTEQLPEATFNTSDRAPWRGVVPPSPAGTYGGVPLSEDKTTIVRLYGAARGAAGRVRGATALLWGFRSFSPRHGRSDVRPLPGSPLRPQSTPTGLEADPDLAGLRADDAGSFNFVLPSSWTRASASRRILVGEVAPRSVSTALRDCCPDNNRFALTGVPFSETRTATLYPVGLIDSKQPQPGPTLPLDDNFDAMRVVWPGPLRIAPPLATGLDLTDIGDIVRATPGTDYHLRIIAELDELYGDMPLRGKIIGLMGGDNCSGQGPGPIAALNTNCANYELATVAHESGHTLGLKHAHSGDCGEVGYGRKGPIRGVGLDTRLWSGSGPGRLRPIGAEQASVFDANPDAPSELYDYMSYCANPFVDDPFPGRSWVSTPYWATTVRELVPGGRIDVGFSGDCCFLRASDPAALSSSRRPRAATTQSPIIRVSALLHPADGRHRILRIEPATGRPQDYAAGGGGPPVQIIIRHAGGSVISTTEVGSRVGSENPGEEYVHAAVPSAEGAARVEIRRGGALLAQRTASASAPEAKLRRPSRGHRIGGAKLMAAWTASDADGDPLTSRLEFSSDKGKSWRGLAAGLSGHKARVSRTALPRTRKGILRVVVSDGFNVDRSQARRIRSKGSKPEATITVPGEKKLKVLGDTNLTFQGEAFDDRGKPIKNKKLSWVSKGKRIGNGPDVDAPVHKLGGKVKLIATDYAKRRAADKLRLKIKKVAPLFTTLEARRLGAKSRKLPLKLATTLPGKVTVAGKGIKRKRTKLGTKAKNVKAKLTGKRRASYDVKLRLRAGGKKTRERIEVTRG